MLDEAWLDLARGVGPWCGAAVLVSALGYLLAPSHVDTPEKKAYYGSSTLALVHGIFVSILALMAGLENGFWTVTWEPWDYHAMTPATARCIHVFLAFLLTDLVPLFYFRNEWTGTALYIGHHTLSCVAWGDAALNGTCHNVALGLLLCEATSPFINGRYFLSTHGANEPCAWPPLTAHGLRPAAPAPPPPGLKSSPLYLYNGVAMALSFLGLRVLGMGFLGLKLFVVDAATSHAVLGNKTCGSPPAPPSSPPPPPPPLLHVPRADGWRLPTLAPPATGVNDPGTIDVSRRHRPGTCWFPSFSLATGCSSRGSRRLSAACLPS